MKVLIISEDKPVTDQVSKIIKQKYGNDVDIFETFSKVEIDNIILEYSPIHTIIFDCRQKKFPIAETLEHIKEQIGIRPTLYMGQLATLKDLIPQELYNDHKLNEFLITPIEAKELSFKIGNIYDWIQDEDYQNSIEEGEPEDFIPMKIKHFFIYDSFKYPIYINISTGRYYCLIEAKKTYTISLLTNYVRKGVKELYIKKDDHLKYLEGELKWCLKELTNKIKTKNESHELLVKCIQTLQYQLAEVGITPKINELMELTLDALYNIATRGHSFKGTLKDYPFKRDGIPSKALITCYLAGLICQDIGYHSLSAQKRIYAAAILMDYKGNDLNDLYKVNFLHDKRYQQSKESFQEAFKNHPIKNADIATQFSGFSDLDHLILNHHEYPDRLGFPKRPGASKLNVSNGILNLSQYLAANFVDKKPNKKDLKEYMKFMKKNYEQANFRDVVLSIEKILKSDDLL